MRFSFQERQLIPEIMDDLDMSGKMLHDTLGQLQMINKWLGGYAIIKDSFHYFIKKYDWKCLDTPLRIADIGCGGGDTLRALSGYFKKESITASFYGFDANPHIIDYARIQSGSYPEIQYEVLDMFSESFLTRSFDVIMFNLILHHFDTQTLQDYIPKVCNQTTYGVTINDLQRHWLPYLLFQGVTRVCGANHMTRHDGLLSIRKGFTHREWQKIAKNVLPYPYLIKWRWAFRHQIIIDTHEQLST